MTESCHGYMLFHLSTLVLWHGTASIFIANHKFDQVVQPPRLLSYTHTRLHNKHTHAHTHKRKHAHTHTRTPTHTHTHTRTRVPCHTPTRTRARTHTCARTRSTCMQFMTHAHIHAQHVQNPWTGVVSMSRVCRAYEWVICAHEFCCTYVWVMLHTSRIVTTSNVCRDKDFPLYASIALFIVLPNDIFGFIHAILSLFGKCIPYCPVWARLLFSRVHQWLGWLTDLGADEVI